MTRTEIEHFSARVFTIPANAAGAEGLLIDGALAGGVMRPDLGRRGIELELRRQSEDRFAP